MYSNREEILPRVYVFLISQVHIILKCFPKDLPILKEPPAVLLTHMAKKSRSAQTVSIFYDSSWVLPRGCPCHSHLKGRQRTQTALRLYMSQHQEVHTQSKALRHILRQMMCSKWHISVLNASYEEMLVLLVYFRVFRQCFR